MQVPIPTAALPAALAFSQEMWRHADFCLPSWLLKSWGTHFFDKHTPTFLALLGSGKYSHFLCVCDGGILQNITAHQAQHWQPGKGGDGPALL